MNLFMPLLRICITPGNTCNPTRMRDNLILGQQLQNYPKLSHIHVRLHHDCNAIEKRQVFFAGCRLQVTGWNLIITGKPLTLKIINNPDTRQGFLHKVVRPFHIVKIRSIRHKCLSIDTLRPVKSLQSHLNGRSTDVSIDSRIGSVNKNWKLNRRLPSQMKQINKEMK